jgi:hypothetical protein
VKRRNEEQYVGHEVKVNVNSPDIRLNAEKEVENLKESLSIKDKKSDQSGDLLSLETNREYDVTVQDNVSMETGSKISVNKKDECVSKWDRCLEYTQIVDALESLPSYLYN